MSSVTPVPSRDLGLCNRRAILGTKTSAPAASKLMAATDVGPATSKIAVACVPVFFCSHPALITRYLHGRSLIVTVSTVKQILTSAHCDCDCHWLKLCLLSDAAILFHSILNIRPSLVTTESLIFVASKPCSCRQNTLCPTVAQNPRLPWYQLVLCVQDSWESCS